MGGDGCRFDRKASEGLQRLDCELSAEQLGRLAATGGTRAHSSFLIIICKRFFSPSSGVPTFQPRYLRSRLSSTIYPQVRSSPSWPISTYNGSVLSSQATPGAILLISLTLHGTRAFSTLILPLCSSASPISKGCALCRSICLNLAQNCSV